MGRHAKHTTMQSLIQNVGGAELWAVAHEENPRGQHYGTLAVSAAVSGVIKVSRGAAIDQSAASLLSFSILYFSLWRGANESLQSGRL